ncbi:unnamed protein product [Caenorhabditis bovis]|uniref:Myeloid leukemia factor n=1 Tax=Caenorhabditis bovis TaxID=2654633 RepID=A0A8S1EZB5_9PELO|nr:unnamed protein product [Caenorhabditis bovis]
MNAMGQMHRQMMQDMDMMMEGMLGRSMGSPFGAFPRLTPFGFGGNPFGAITDGSGHRPSNRRQELEMDPFSGFGGLLGAMANGGLPASGSNMFVHSTVMTMGPDGKPCVEQKTVRKSGDVTETKRKVERDGESTITIGHTIGDRQHIIEKKRDKDGNVRKQQKFRNLDEEQAEEFDREFATRIRSNNGYSSRLPNSSAIEFGSRSHHAPAPRASGSGAPIITLPEEEEGPEVGHSSYSRRNNDGPVIREISDEEAEQSIPKRRRGLFGGFRAE